MRRRRGQQHARLRLSTGAIAAPLRKVGVRMVRAYMPSIDGWAACGAQCHGQFGMSAGKPLQGGQASRDRRLVGDDMEGESGTGQAGEAASHPRQRV